MSWSPINYPDLTVRAIGVAVVVMIGNTGSIVASYIFDSSSAPDYGKVEYFSIKKEII
jgi:hypothetical protein